MANEISEATGQFIHDAFANLDQLRIFLLLSTERERFYTPGALSAQLNQSFAKVNEGLAQLGQIGLIESVTEPEARYRFYPASPGLAQLSEEIVRLDKEMPVTLIRLFANRPIEPIKAFANAFKLR